MPYTVSKQSKNDEVVATASKRYLFIQRFACNIIKV